MSFHMNRSARPESRPSRSRKTCPALEGLEDRRLLYATTGGNFYFGSRITYSFAPDGTSIGGIPSVLNQRLNAEGLSTASWQSQFQKAAAVWEAVANVQLAQVGDDGSAIGTSGNQQDDPRFGDIRIAGFAQGNASQLAFTFSPPPFNGGTLAGDLLLNTDQPWQANGSVYDLETVAIHEIGHALGMAHSAIASADMYAWYTNAKQSATPDDAAGIQSIYGPVGADPLPNSSFAAAIDLTPLANSYGHVMLGGQSLKDPNTDVDYFKVTAPATTTGTLTVVMQAGNLSSLSPRVLVYDQNQNFVGQSSQPYSYGGNAIVAINGVTPGKSYYIRCQAASNDPSGVGAYALLTSFGGPGLTPMAPPNTVVAQQPDKGGGGLGLGTSGLPTGAFSAGQTLSAILKAAEPIFQSNHIPIDDLLKMYNIGTLWGAGDSLSIAPEPAHAALGHPHGPAPFAGQHPRHEQGPATHQHHPRAGHRFGDG